MHRAALILFVVGCQSSSSAPAPKAKPAAKIDASPNFGKMDGKQIYQQVCAPCHGVEGKGYVADHAPSLVSKTFLESATDDFLRRSIYTGRPGTAMAAYGVAMGGPLAEGDVSRLIGYLRTFGPAPSTIPAASGGNAVHGAVLYAKHCASCHGDAQTRGEGVSLANPQFLAAATDSFIRYAIVNGRPDTKMVAWGSVLSPTDIDDVVAAVRRLGAAPVPEVTLLPEPTGKEPLVINPKGGAPDWKLRADPCPATPIPNAPPCLPNPKYVSVDAVKDALAAGKKLIIIDARPASDWRRVHIPGTVSIPYLDMKRLSEVPTDGTWVVAYCACPHHLSGIVIDELRKRGFKNTAILDEGILEWHRRGYPVTAAQGVTPPPKEPGLPPGALR